ncbi:hypothetical protein A2962_04120 [Candidatus Woesebacteria bacterium RIFCSPLOWO2_01_FULL_39_61]|uniref:Uncharacterized protein n=1 Tax=Candidatus Woesebacteria bacterium RIFCSPHIGHO2_02_FULL_39_13 TaxID=1802505 RepID=A0A1F7YZP5_9BACT|nr:MAG: hypothetical protein A2692_00475 [Candidatus Woesebacteria bacterium RIFCSPHIGHO2_01_FULL_39_95]OGM32148.1 MAG: hypothetical protein A3D01_02055 [Candidatus Woesebacteria bacterium RIFCSPHIGHO2_02_FULL_39_13]OGM36598.1 MAG: hypothetical protein A3E13_02895 [Candidatus Woesebacteria bacterium RIFCSPHIGHO2_12_FULL_40_20]OGM65939.1 MAG: hypothetical protein A2962_04120 [Candidatus Woesebacteria bacterium RIFCSPLOWO2_01_FULL_39_61]OGM71420.1 MAG: hypothetical protein A3H19_04615 [Candidatus
MKRFKDWYWRPLRISRKVIMIPQGPIVVMAIGAISGIVYSYVPLHPVLLWFLLGVIALSALIVLLLLPPNYRR